MPNKDDKKLNINWSIVITVALFTVTLFVVWGNYVQENICGGCSNCCVYQPPRYDCMFLLIGIPFIVLFLICIINIIRGKKRSNNAKQRR